MQPKEKPRPVQTSRGELCLFLSFSLDGFSAARQQVPQAQVPTVGQCFRHREPKPWADRRIYPRWRTRRIYPRYDGPDRVPTRLKRGVTAGSTHDQSEPITIRTQDLIFHEWRWRGPAAAKDERKAQARLRHL